MEWLRLWCGHVEAWSEFTHRVAAESLQARLRMQGEGNGSISRHVDLLHGVHGRRASDERLDLHQFSVSSEIVTWQSRQRASSLI
jgi:hypothetical protein